MKCTRRVASIKRLLLAAVMSAIVVLVGPVKVMAVTINGLGYFTAETARYNSMPGVNSITGAYDVRGRINNSSSYTLQTTYSNGGYTIDFEVDGANRSIQKVANNTTITNNGVNLTVRAEATAEGLDVHLDINNPEGNGDHTYRVAMTADIQLGSNDYAAIYKKEYSGVVVTQDNSSYTKDYGAKVYIDFNPVVDTLWIGDYKERLNNKYVDGEVAAYTAADNVDTAVAWSWDNTLADGEAVVLTVSYNLIETNKTYVSFYDLDEAFIESRESLVGGALTLPELEDDKPGYFHVWCTDKADEATCKNGGETIIVTEDDMNFYENYVKNQDAWSNINYYDTDENLTDTVEELEGETTTLPELEDDKPGYFHVWCTDKADEATCKNGGETIIVTEDDMNFYENYVADPNAKQDPVEEPEVDLEDDDDGSVEYVVSYETENGRSVDTAANDNGYYYGVLQQDNDPEVIVPTVSADIRDDTINKNLEETKPLGVTMREDLQGQGILGMLQELWPYIITILCSLGLFFFIIFFAKRRKDDEDEEDGEKS